MEIKSYKFDENKSFIEILGNIKPALFGLVFWWTVVLAVCIFIIYAFSYYFNSKCDKYIIKFIIIFLEFIFIFLLIRYVIKLFNKKEDFSTNILKIETSNFGNREIKYSKEKDLEYIVEQIMGMPQTVQKELYYICDSEISKLKIPILQKSIIYTSIIGIMLFSIRNIRIIPLSVFLFIAAFILNYFYFEKEQYEQKKILLEESKRAILILQNIIK